MLCPDLFCSSPDLLPAPINTNRTNFMAEKSIEEKVKDIIVEQLGVNPEQVTPHASFIEDLGADSLDIVELVMAFEEEFAVEVRTKTPKNCRPSATSSNTSKKNRPSSSSGFRNVRRSRGQHASTSSRSQIPKATSIFAAGALRRSIEPVSCHVERSETSRIVAVTTRSRSDQRFFAPLRMTCLRRLQLSTVLFDRTTCLSNAAR